MSKRLPTHAAILAITLACMCPRLLGQHQSPPVAAGRRIELGDRLSPSRGRITLTITTPSEAPGPGGQSLLHIRGVQGRHISLTSYRGVLVARYGDGGDRDGLITYRPSRLWPAESRHTIELAWRPCEGVLLFTMRTDGVLTGTSPCEPLEQLDSICLLGGDGETLWQGTIDHSDFSAEAPYPAELLPGSRDIHVDADRPLGPCYNFFRVGNLPKPYLLTEPDNLKWRRVVRPYMKEINCVYLLGGRYREYDTYYKGLDENGRVVADFTEMIAQLKVVLDDGATPRIVLDNVPFAMSDPPEENTYGNTAPPADEAVWADYVEQAVRAMVEAFGREQVGQWYFRVGTEPDLKPAHWSGTQQHYFDHYDHTVAAVKRVLDRPRIAPGNILNPAAERFGLRMGDLWGLDIIDHCATGVNAVTGDVGTDMTWFSISWYARVGFPVSIFDEAIEAVRRRLDTYPRFAEIPISVGEFAILGDEHGRRLWAGDTTEWAASFYAALADRVYAHDVKQVYEWDQTTGGVYHPRAHVQRMLTRMLGGSRLSVTVNGASDARCGAIAVKREGRIFVILYNHRMWRWPDVEEKVRLTVSDSRMSPESPWRLDEWSVDAEHAAWGRVFEQDCLDAGIEPLARSGKFEGSPSRRFGERGVKLFSRNRRKYMKLAELPQTRENHRVTSSQGNITLEVTLPGHGVRFLELRPAESN